MNNKEHQWTQMDTDGRQLKPMNVNETQSTPMNPHGHWTPMNVDEHQWKPMTPMHTNEH